MQNFDFSKGVNSTMLRGFSSGLILGDAYIDKGITKRSVRLKSINKEFIDFVYNFYTQVTNMKLYVTHYDAYTGRDNIHHKEYWELHIKAHPYFAKLYHYFYNDERQRIIHPKVLKWLNPIGLANWYMSDGYICLVGKTKGFIRDRRVEICTDRYSLEDIQLLQVYFKDVYNINVSIVKRESFYRIRINKDSYEMFFSLIKDYIVPSMYYKLYLGYNNKQDFFSDTFWEFQKNLQSAIALTGKAEG